jgi:predicted transcriptional regulator
VWANQQKRNHMKDKQVAIETINNLPENASMEEIAEELQIMAAIRKGKEDVRAGRVKSHAQVEKMFEEWISK